MDSEISQDIQTSNPQAMSKFENTRRKKPWEVFKKQTESDDKQETIQYDSFRDKNAQTQLTGAGFTAMLNNVMQQDNSFQIKLNKNQYYQNLNKNKKLFGLNNYQNPKSSRQPYQHNNQGHQNKHQEEHQQPRFNNSVNNNFQKQNNFRGNTDQHSSNENTNNANYNGNKFNKNPRFNPFGQQDQSKENLVASNEPQDQEALAKMKYFERKQRKLTETIQQQASRALRREQGENVPSNDEDGANYNLSDSSSVGSDSDGGKNKRYLTDSQKKKRTGMSRRRQKLCGSWVRVCDAQKLDKPPSYKEYLGKLTNPQGKRPLRDMFTKKDEDLCEVNKELAADAEDGELKAVADLEDGEIKLQEVDLFLKNKIQEKEDNEVIFPFPTRKEFQKPNKSKNFMNVNTNKILNTIRKTSLFDEEDDATQKKKLKIPTKDELIEQENKLIEDQEKEDEELFSNPIQLLKRMDQLGNEVYKNRTGNNFQMQQTLATQQDRFLESYFNKGKKGEKNQDPNAAKKEKRFDVRNYQVDLEKNMVENKVQITEGLRNLAKIQSELYISGMKKKKQPYIPQSSGSASKINKMLQQDSTEKELRDASQRLSLANEMKEVQSKLNFDSNKSHPLLLQKERKNEHFNQALNQFEQEQIKKEQQIKATLQSQLKDESKEMKVEKEVKEGEQENKEETDKEKIQNEDEMNFEDEDLNEFDKFNDEYMMQQEKMLEEIQKKNKEKVNQIKNSKSYDLGLGLDFGIEGSEKVEEELNPLERMIQEELEKTRQDKQAQNYRLMELQKLQENQHIQHLHLLAKSTTNDNKPTLPNISYQNDNPSAKLSQQQLHAMANNPTSRDNNKGKRNKFSEISTITPQLANYEAHAQMERLKQLTQQRTEALQEQSKIGNQANGISSLAQLQQQLFSKNQNIIKSQGLSELPSKIETEIPYQKSSRFTSHPPPPPPPNHSNRHNEYQNDRHNRGNKEEYGSNSNIRSQQISRKPSFDKDVIIPDIFKIKESELKPEVYEKIVLEYNKMYKKSKEEVQLDKIKDPRLRARAVISLEEKSQSFAEQLLRNNQEKIHNFIPMASDDHSLPLPSLQDDSGDKRKSSLLNFSVETSTMPSNMEIENGQEDKVVYNYKVLKSDKTFITQEKNLIEKNNTLSFLQNSSQGPSAVQVLEIQKNESHEQQQSNEISDMFKNEREVRYFKENNQMFCFKCNQNGHAAKWCTAPVDEKVKCLFCMGDHSKEYCTNYVCFKCYLVGHRIKDCAFEQSMDQSRCRICRKKGHTIKNCGSLNIDIVHKTYDFNSISDTICLTCDQPGHINCFNPHMYINYDGLYKLDKKALEKIN